MIKAKTFFLIAFAVFFSLFIIKIIEKGYTYKSISKNLHFQMKLNSDEKFIAVIIPSYNNEEYVERNLTSVFDQEYKNFTVIFIDDFSSDSTLEKAKEVISRYGFQDRVSIIRNEENQKALYNLYYAIQAIEDDVICYILDGDDWFATKTILKDLNRYYKNDDIWATYSRYVTFPKYEKSSFDQVSVKKHSLRNQDLPTPRSFYAGLFKKIKMKDLIFKGEFLKASHDKSIAYPIWEMAREHVLFIPDVMYVYNRESPLNEDKLRKEKQKILNRYVKSLDAYPRITSYKSEALSDDKIACVIFSENRPMQLLSFLESLEFNDVKFNSLTVFYQAEESEVKKGYEQLEKMFSGRVSFYPFETSNELTRVLTELDASYITFAKDTTCVNRKIDVKKSLTYLEKTGAYGIYFDLGLNLFEVPSKTLPVGDGFFIFDFSSAPQDWKLANRLDLSLYKKDSVFHYLQKIQFKTIKEFEEKWKRGQELRGVGLFHKESKAVNIQYQITKVDTQEKIYLYSLEDLNKRFLDGYKIDVNGFREIHNTSNQVEFYPKFIERKAHSSPQSGRD
jgi:glycosyltransferase involved in cell wall biosynthesis